MTVCKDSFHLWHKLNEHCMRSLYFPAALPSVPNSAPEGHAQHCLSDQLSQNCPQRCVRVLMDFYLMRDDISYGFHNSQAMWPKDHHAWQHLLLHSLTKLGVHWVCVDCKTCNVQCRFRTHWVKCISLERQKHQEKLWEKKFKNTHSNFSLQKPAHSFSLLI